MLISFAHQLPPFRLVGGPSWITTARYDIVAKLPVSSTSGAPGAGRDPIQDVRDALRALLSDRFKLAAHQETRELDIYALVLARPGGRPSPSMKPSAQHCAAAAVVARNSGASPSPVQGEPIFCGLRQSGGRIQVGGMPLSQFASILAGQGQVGRVVVDRTGLAGTWDFELTFAPTSPAPALGLPPSDATAAPPSDPDAPSIFTALQEQLGLKLESTKGPVDVVVIDHVEQPKPD
jgi:bla regulator protein blaR1